MQETLTRDQMDTARAAFKAKHRAARVAARPVGFTAFPIPFNGDVTIWPIGGGHPASVARNTPNPRGVAATLLALCHEARAEGFRVVRRDLHRKYLTRAAVRRATATLLP